MALRTLDVLYRALVALLLLLLLFNIYQLIPEQLRPIKFSFAKFQTAWVEPAMKWYSSYLLSPYYIPEEVKKEFADCNVNVKSVQDYIFNQEKITLCRREVALALLMWKYIEEGSGNVSFDYLSEYRVPEEYIEEMERMVAEREEFEIALSLLELYEKCVSGPVECAISNAELVSPENIKKLKNVKVSMKDVGIFGQIMWYAEAWKAAAGEESFETCDARCREAFYMPFEVGDSGGSVSITATPFQITKVLYTNRDRIEATLCRGNLENCPAIKTCMEGYEIYEKEGESALRELIEKGVHDACFLVAKEFLMAREGKKVYPV